MKTKPLFQKRHYEFLAAAINRYIRNPGNIPSNVVIYLSDELRDDNPQFDGTKFVKACFKGVIVDEYKITT